MRCKRSLQGCLYLAPSDGFDGGSRQGTVMACSPAKIDLKLTVRSLLMTIRAIRPSCLAAPFFAFVCLAAQAQSTEKPLTARPAATSPAAAQTPAVPPAAAQPANAQSATETPSCSVTATDKKLAGAAKNSFLKKCEREATATCETAATDRKLAGAAKNSFLKKCIKDAVGA